MKQSSGHLAETGNSFHSNRPGTGAAAEVLFHGGGVTGDLHQETNCAWHSHGSSLKSLLESFEGLLQKYSYIKLSTGGWGGCTPVSTAFRWLMQEDHEFKASLSFKARCCLKNKYICVCVYTYTYICIYVCIYMVSSPHLICYSTEFHLPR